MSSQEEASRKALLYAFVQKPEIIKSLIGLVKTDSMLISDIMLESPDVWSTEIENDISFSFAKISMNDNEIHCLMSGICRTTGKLTEHFRAKTILAMCDIGRWISKIPYIDKPHANKQFIYTTIPNSANSVYVIIKYGPCDIHQFVTQIQTLPNDQFKRFIIITNVEEAQGFNRYEQTLLTTHNVLWVNLGPRFKAFVKETMEFKAQPDLVL